MSQPDKNIVEQEMIRLESSRRTANTFESLVFGKLSNPSIELGWGLSLKETLKNKREDQKTTEFDLEAAKIMRMKNPAIFAGSSRERKAVSFMLKYLPKLMPEKEVIEKLSRFAEILFIRFVLEN